jgi:hypothetical protein
MFRVIAILVGIVLFLQLLGWFFTVALPFCFRLLGDGLTVVFDLLSGAVTWLTDAWRGLRGLFIRSSPEGPDATQPERKSLLESADNPDINLPSNLTPTPAMWPFGSKDKPDPKSTNSSSSRAAFPPPSLSSPAKPPGNVPIPELDKLKGDLFRAQNSIKTLEATIKDLNQVNAQLNDERRHWEAEMVNARMERDRIIAELISRANELEQLNSRHALLSAELEALKPFAAIKTDQRRMTYTVSPELHKKWQSIMRDTTRLQVLELLGQPTEILAVTSGGASPIQLVRKGVPAPRPELLQHVTSLVVGDALLKAWVAGVGRTAWVYADDTIAPGVIFFASESDGGQVFRIFPPEC